PAVASALLPAALRGGGTVQGDGPLQLVPRDLRPRAAAPDPAEGGRARPYQARDHDPQDVAPAPAPRDGRVRQGLQRGLVAQLGLRAVLQGGPRRLHDRHAAGLRPRLVHDRRAGRADGCDGHLDPRYPPGLQEDAGPPAAPGWWYYLNR